METSKENLQVIFNSIDKDGSGQIEYDELIQLSKELGHELKEQEAKIIIRIIDTNGDKTISFEEFYQWWYYGKQNKLEKLIFMKFKGTKTLKKVQKKLQKKLGPLLEQKYNNDQSSHYFQVNIGQFDQSHFSVTVDAKIGQNNKEYRENYIKYFPYLDENVPFVIYRLKCKNSELVRLKLEEFIVNGLELAFTMIPEEKVEQANLLKDMVKFEYATLPDQVLLRIYVQNDIIEAMLVQGQMLASMFIQDDTAVHAKVKIETMFGYSDLLQNKQENILNLINRGFRVTGDFSANSGLIQALRQFYFMWVEKVTQQNNVPHKFKPFVKNCYLSLLQTSKVVLNFAAFEQFAQEMQLPVHNIPSCEMGVNQIKQMNVQDLLANIPFIADLVEVLKNECDGQYSIIVMEKSSSVTLHGHGDGVSELWDILLG